ncbi:MAG: aspartyl/asparaginyl beta-hydroxylase domain-containing protein [Paraglaciecola sp.]|uniref:aspartyl/asparaginyl beta-hydroxylase domain-containing protein n=1 Tax=Paraglaciecola sp. TaxID=1920173 RepID=UPI003296ECC5
MRMDCEFVKLPFEFDVEQMAQEVSQFSESSWLPHPSKHIGNSALPLISYEGQDNDLFCGTMKETPHLQKCEYIRQIASSFGEVLGRSRFMRLAAGSDVPIHVDAIYHWHRHVRIHIPVITNEKVIFHCGTEKVNMKAGECWLFDSWRNHKVVNSSQETRVHLVIDTAGSSRFWDLVDSTLSYYRDNGNYPSPQYLNYVPSKQISILLEKYNITPVLSPGEIEGLIEDIIYDMRENSGNDVSKVKLLTKQMIRFCQDWRMIFSVYGYEGKGIPHYLNLLKSTQNTLSHMNFDVHVKNGQLSKTILYARVFSAAISPAVREDYEQALSK